MSRPHILVIDDEPHVALIIEHAGRFSGYRVSSARSIAEGRTLLAKEDEVDLLLLDVKLPDGSGLDFLDELRRAPGTRQFPVIVLTGAGYDDVLDRAAAAGAECVTKPFSPSKLGRKVADLLGFQTSTDR
jgi:CheY-like chemotaxis protein